MPTVSMKVNGQSVSHDVADNTLLVTFLRETLGLTGTHIGCDTSQCGACVIHVNGASVKSCTMLAAQADGAEVTTIEGIANGDDLPPMQQAFHENHGSWSIVRPSLFLVRRQGFWNWFFHMFLGRYKKLVQSS